jgi:hypothetical protein
MCRDSCVLFVSPYTHLKTCPKPGCGLACYRLLSAPTAGPVPHRNIPPSQSVPNSLPSGPLTKLSTLTSTTCETKKILTANGHLPIISLYSGQDYLTKVDNGEIGDYDLLISLSVDGAQLIRDKHSNTWFLTLINHNLPESVRWKHEYGLLSGIIGGPNNSWDLQYFHFPTVVEVHRLQRDGLSGIDFETGESFMSMPAVITGDKPAIAKMNQTTGPGGTKGCWSKWCDCKGICVPGSSKYYLPFRPPAEPVGSP